jgi:hypothetical protein
MPYTAGRRPQTPSSDELRQRIPGWGADLDPADRPAVPRERFDPSLSGAHWDFPERQPEKWPRERSVEHEFLTPVFGTSTPPKGLSGVIRRYAYSSYSEGRAAHWLLLIAADRVDAVESHLASFLTLHPDNPVTETGVLSEYARHGVSSRLGRRRADLAHQPLDPVVVAGPWVAAGAAAYLAVRGVVRTVRR